MNNVRPVIALAFAEDAMAIASWAEQQGFPEDAAAMRRFSQKVRAELPVTSRWSGRRVEVHAS